MKILYHHRIRSKDGQYVHLSELVGALREQGHEVTIVGPLIIENEPLGADAGWTATLRETLPKGAYEALEFSYAFGDVLRLAAAIRRHRPDAIYERYNLFFPSGIWASRLFGLPLLLEVNSPLFDERSRFGGVSLVQLARWSERFVWRRASAVLPVTAVLAGMIEAAGVPREQITVIPNGINEDEFSCLPAAPAAKRALGLADRFVIGFVGFMRDWHGLERVVDFVAGARRPDLHALFVGDGPARASVISLARELGVEDRVTVTGVVGRSEIPRHLAAFDIAVQPAVVEYASPLKLFEYLAVGLPIVAPNTPNIREVLGHRRNALLFEPAVKTSFSDALQALCDDPDLRRALAEAARRTIGDAELTWRTNAARIARIAALASANAHSRRG